MTNPFNNPFNSPFDASHHPSQAPLSSAPQPSTPQWPVIDPVATAAPRPVPVVLKVFGWILFLFGALITIAALADWSQLGMSIGMTFFGLSFVVVGTTMIWRRLPWRVAGPLAGVLMVVCLVIVGATAEPPDQAAAQQISAAL